MKCENLHWITNTIPPSAKEGLHEFRTQVLAILYKQIFVNPKSDLSYAGTWPEIGRKFEWGLYNNLENFF